MVKLPSLHFREHRFEPWSGNKDHASCIVKQKKKPKRQRKILLCSYVHRCRMFLTEYFCRGSVIKVRFTFHKIILITNLQDVGFFLYLWLPTDRPCYIYLTLAYDCCSSSKSWFKTTNLSEKSKYWKIYQCQKEN